MSKTGYKETEKCTPETV